MPTLQAIRNWPMVISLVSLHRWNHAGPGGPVLFFHLSSAKLPNARGHACAPAGMDVFLASGIPYEYLWATISTWARWMESLFALPLSFFVSILFNTSPLDIVPDSLSSCSPVSPQSGPVLIVIKSSCTSINIVKAVIEGSGSGDVELTVEWKDRFESS